MTAGGGLAAGSALGPYLIQGELGRGCYGIVYRARGPGGEEVALKTVLEEGREAAVALRRDYYALSRLAHPGVPAVRGEGVSQAPPWYAMDLVEGATLLDHARRLWDPATGAELPAPALHAILGIASSAFEALAYLHGEGIVHRDLKPDHFLVRGDGSVVIVDFGLMSLREPGSSRERLEVGGEILGSAATMAPEQWRGELVDARADLYAMGCILHALLTGEFPFRTRREVLDPRRTPAAPGSRFRGIPPLLDELVMSLLEKRLEQRMGYAEDALRLLATLGAPASRRGAARPYVYRPRLLGRGPAVAELDARLDALDEGRGGVLVLEGRSGAGKTRLAMEVVSRARSRGVTVLLGECPEPVAGATPAALAALQAPLRALAERCLDLGPEETTRLLGDRGKVLALYQPALAELVADAPEPAALSVSGSRLRLFTYLAETFEALATAGPLLLVIEDLHWADELSLGFLELLEKSRRLESLAWVVIATCRSDDEGTASGVLGGAARSLEPLASAAVEEIVTDMIATPEAPAALLEVVARESEGNPFIAVEYLRAAVASGWLRRDEGGRWQVPRERAADRPPLPGTIRELVARRLDGLPVDARRLVEAASIVGRQGTEELWRAIAGLDEARSAHAVAHLVGVQVLEHADDGRYRFVHDKVREVAELALDGDRRRALHGVAAKRLEVTLAGPDGGIPDEHASALAHHWQQAGASAKARRHYLRAAQRAVRVHALAEAEALYRAYLATSEAPDLEVVTARNDLAERVLFPLGRGDEALVELARSLEGARAIQDRGQEVVALWVGGLVRDHQGATSEALACLEEARDAAVASGQPVLEALVLGSLAALMRGLGRLDEARALYERALGIHEAAGHRGNVGAVTASLGSLEYDRGRLDEARRLFEQAVATLREAGDRGKEALTLVNLANVELEQGRPARAAPLYEEALAMHREIGDRRAEGAILANMASLRKAEGRLDDAARLCEEGLVLARGSGARRIEGHLLAELALLRLHDARLEEARGLQEEALRGHREQGDRHAEGRLLVAMATRARWTGDAAAALQLAASAAGILEQVDARLDRALALVERGHAELALGSEAPAGDDLLAAEAIAREIGSGAGSDLERRIRALERAIEARRTSTPLLRGELPAELPPAIRRLSGG